MPTFHKGIPLLGLAFALGGCATTDPLPLLDQPNETRWPRVEYASPSRTILVAVGDDLRLTVRTVGPGDFDTAPAVTGDAVLFTQSKLSDVQVPAGPTRDYYFQVPHRGTAIVRFENTASSVVIVDTLVVQ